MEPDDGMNGQLVKITDFIQTDPSDGQPATQRTDVYMGYDDKYLYAVFLCFDTEPDRIRARLIPRDDIFAEDFVEIMLDTFNDQRRAYAFFANPHGVQMDIIFTEGGPQRVGPAGFDVSFDTLWYSEGRLTEQGYVIWMAIPFKSLRFPATEQQTWGILLARNLLRVNERDFWPHMSSRIEGRLNQAALLRGLENISPGRNMQFIPYAVFRSFRALDLRDPGQPRFVRDRADPDAGMDAKFVLKDSLVLDVALNPDFSQVESDEPQVTVNQRFEVFFPEKRPFFLENAGFFQTPINLVFTRRIADPQFGVRLTGKAGPYALGALLVDDESPGKRALGTDPVRGKRAFFSLLRFNRDLFRQSTIGAIYTDREFETSHNRVGGLDGRFKLGQNWVMTFQGVASRTRFLDGSRLAGPAYEAALNRTGRQLNLSFEYNDRNPGFLTLPGFVERSDIRRIAQSFNYRFRPEGRYLIAWGPSFSTDRVWDHTRKRLDWTYDSKMSWEFIGRTTLDVFYTADRERLRPEDFPLLAEDRDFDRNRKGLAFRSSYYRQFTFSGEYSWGTRINFVPPDDPALPLQSRQPTLANLISANLTLTVQPITQLLVNNTYLLTRLKDRTTNATLFNNHIVRSKWNWQFTRELSLRLIFHYTTVLASHSLTALESTKNFNADFLLTYLLHPGTALYVGYNSNLQNVDLVPMGTGAALLRPRNRFTNDAKQFFVKFSYLFRF